MSKKLLCFVLLLFVGVGVGVAGDVPAERVSMIERVKQAVAGFYGTGATVALLLEADGRGESRLLMEDRTGLSDSAVNWSRPVVPMGSCDSEEDCEEATNQMCEDHGYDEGVEEDTVGVTTHMDGSKTCSGDCEGESDRGTSGAVALVFCQPPSSTHSMDNEPRPDGPSGGSARRSKSLQ